jgi:hypothetical protein
MSRKHERPASDSDSEAAKTASWVPGPSDLAMDASTAAANRAPRQQGPHGGRSTDTLRRLSFADEAPQLAPSSTPSADRHRLAPIDAADRAAAQLGADEAGLRFKVAMSASFGALQLPAEGPGAGPAWAGDVVPVRGPARVF